MTLKADNSRRGENAWRKFSTRLYSIPSISSSTMSYNIYLCTCMCVCMHVRTCICVLVFHSAYILAYACMHAGVSSSFHNVCVCVHVYICVHVGEYYVTLVHIKFQLVYYPYLLTNTSTLYQTRSLARHNCTLLSC